MLAFPAACMSASDTTRHHERAAGYLEKGTSWVDEDTIGGRG